MTVTTATSRIEAASYRNAERLSAEGNREARRRIAQEVRIRRRYVRLARLAGDGSSQQMGRHIILGLLDLAHIHFPKDGGC